MVHDLRLSGDSMDHKARQSEIEAAAVTRGDVRQRRNFAGAVAGIIAAAFLVRLAYLYQIENLPFFYHLVGDAKSYWEWSGRIASGDWLGAEAFYQAPAYPYFLALVRAVVGDDLWRVRVVQIALGSIACGLLALAGRRFISPRAGLWSGAIMALYGPAVFFDGLIQKANLSPLLMAAVLGLLGWRSTHRGRSGYRAWTALVAGVLLGLLALTTEQALLLLPVVLVWCSMGASGGGSSLGEKIGSHGKDGGDKPRGSPGRFMPALVLLLGCGVVLGAVAWRNHRVGGVWAITTVQAGPNFYIGNHEGATGRYVPLRPGRETPEFERRDAVELAQASAGVPLSASEVSSYWFRRAWAFIRHQPMRWLRMIAYKWALVWNAYEIPDTESHTLYSHFSWLLGVCGKLNHFGVLCPLAAAGIVVTAPRWRALWMLYAMLFVLAAGVAAFYVFGRYRFPLVPVLALFAGAGAAEIYRLVQSRAWRGGDKPRRSVVMLIVVVLVALATNLRINPEARLDAMAYANLGAVLGQQGSYDSAIYFLNKAVQGAPDSVEAHFNLGMARRLSGDREGALRSFRHVQAIDPQRMEVDFQLGRLYEESGQADDAVRHYQRALEIDAKDEEARARLQGLLSPTTNGD